MSDMKDKYAEKREVLIEKAKSEYGQGINMHVNDFTGFTDENLSKFIDLIESAYRDRVIEAVENRLKYHKATGDSYQGKDFSATMYHRDKLNGLEEAIEAIKQVKL